MLHVCVVFVVSTVQIVKVIRVTSGFNMKPQKIENEPRIFQKDRKMPCKPFIMITRSPTCEFAMITWLKVWKALSILLVLIC